MVISAVFSKTHMTGLPRAAQAVLARNVRLKKRKVKKQETVQEGWFPPSEPWLLLQSSGFNSQHPMVAHTTAVLEDLAPFAVSLGTRHVHGAQASKRNNTCLKKNFFRERERKEAGKENRGKGMWSWM